MEGASEAGFWQTWGDWIRWGAAVAGAAAAAGWAWTRATIKSIHKDIAAAKDERRKGDVRLWNRIARMDDSRGEDRQDVAKTYLTKADFNIGMAGVERRLQGIEDAIRQLVIALPPNRHPAE